MRNSHFTGRIFGSMNCDQQKPLVTDGDYWRIQDAKGISPMIEVNHEIPELLEKTKTLRRKDENLLAFMGRTGAGLTQLQEWTIEGIAKHAAESERQLNDSADIPPQFRVGS